MILVNIKYFELGKLFCSLILCSVYFAGYPGLNVLIISMNNAFVYTASLKPT